jgi:hypothetical protein
MDYDKNHYIEKNKKRIETLTEQKKDTADKYHQYKKAYQAVMGDKFQHYSYTNKSAHKDEVLKVIDSYEERRIDLNATIKKLKENADFSKLDMAVQEHSHELKTPLSLEGKEKAIEKLDKAVAEYEHYKTQLGTAGTEELKNEYHSRMYFMDIMLKTHKISSSDAHQLARKQKIAEDKQMEYNKTRARIAVSGSSEEEKVAKIKEEKQRLDQAWKFAGFTEFSQEYQEKTSAFMEAAKEHVEKNAVLEQVANLYSTSSGMDGEDPDFTAVVEKTTEYMMHKDSADNDDNLLIAMDSVGAYIEKHRHSIMGKSHKRKKIMEQLQKQLLSCLDATKPKEGYEPKAAQKLNATFAADGGSEDFRNVMMLVNKMRLSGNAGNATYSVEARKAARKYIESHKDAHLSMGKQRLALMRQLEEEMSNNSGTTSLEEEKKGLLDNDGIVKDDVEETPEQIAAQKKQTAVWKKHEPEFLEQKAVADSLLVANASQQMSESSLAKYMADFQRFTKAGNFTEAKFALDAAYTWSKVAGYLMKQKDDFYARAQGYKFKNISGESYFSSQFVYKSLPKLKSIEKTLKKMGAEANGLDLKAFVKERDLDRDTHWNETVAQMEAQMKEQNKR